MGSFLTKFLIVVLIKVAYVIFEILNDIFGSNTAAAF